MNYLPGQLKTRLAVKAGNQALVLKRKVKDFREGQTGRLRRTTYHGLQYLPEKPTRAGEIKLSRAEPNFTGYRRTGLS